MSKGTQTRSVILDHAVAVASQFGLEGLTIGGLAKATGLSKSGLFAHFDSKENLQLQVLRAGVERFLSVVVAPSLTEPRGIPRIRAFFDHWMEWDEQSGLPGGCLFIAAVHEFDDRPGAVHDRLVQYQLEWTEFLAKAARIAIDAGDFRMDLDPKQFAFDFQSIVFGYHYFSRLFKDPDALERARKTFEHLLETSKA